MIDGTYCPRCGAKRLGNYRFCTSCQLDFEAATAETAPAVDAAPASGTARASGRGSLAERLVIVGIVAAVVVGGLYLWSSWQVTAILSNVGAAVGTPGATVAATPRSTPVLSVPPVAAPGQASAGEIVFGTGFDEAAFAVTGATRRFKATFGEIAYQASLLRAPGGGDLRITITRRGSGMSESTVFTEDVDVANPQFDAYANTVDLAGLVDNKPGRYVMRFVLDGDVVAEGEFELVK